MLATSIARNNLAIFEERNLCSEFLGSCTALSSFAQPTRHLRELMARQKQNAGARPHHPPGGQEKVFVVSDNLADRLPVTALELDLLERYLGEALDEFLRPRVSIDESV